jgi:hypothetical protein
MRPPRALGTIHAVRGFPLGGLGSWRGTSPRWRRVLLACGVCVLALMMLPEPSGAIFKGYDANPQDFPWYVTLTWKKKEQCGGAVIAPGTVITAAHCVTSDWAQSLKVVFGYRTKSATTASITRVAQNHYDAKTSLNDIALLFLDRGAPSVNPIGLVSADPSPGSWLTAVGFGCSSEPYRSGHGKCKKWPSRLQGIAVQRMRQACRNMSQTDFCISGWDASINHGDSGGPVMIKTGGQWHLAGLNDLILPANASGNGFSPPYFADATSIAQQRTWIDATVPNPAPKPVTADRTVDAPSDTGLPFPMNNFQIGPLVNPQRHMPTLKDAISAFGKPSVCTDLGENVQWPSLDISAEFTTLGGYPQGTAQDGCLSPKWVQPDHYILTGPWRTKLGLKTGDNISRVRQLYPSTQQHPFWQGSGASGSGFWLTRRATPWNGPGSSWGRLIAMIQAGKVSGFYVSLQAQGE